VRSSADGLIFFARWADLWVGILEERTMRPTPFLLLAAGVTFALSASIGCETTTSEKTHYALSDGKSDSILDSRIHQVEAEVVKYAERSGRTPAAVRAALEKEGGLSRIYAGLRREKAIDFVMTRATISGDS